MSRERGTIAEEVARVEALRAELRRTSHELPRRRRHLRRAIARGRDGVLKMLAEAAAE